jgi:hypothetical protein
MADFFAGKRTPSPIDESDGRAAFRSLISAGQSIASSHPDAGNERPPKLRRGANSLISQ